MAQSPAGETSHQIWIGGTRSTSMQGVYFYADFCTGRIWGLRQIGDTWGSALLYDFGEDEDGNLYVTNYNEGFILALEVRIQAPVETVVAQPPREAKYRPVRISSGIIWHPASLACHRWRSRNILDIRGLSCSVA